MGFRAISADLRGLSGTFKGCYSGSHGDSTILRESHGIAGVLMELWVLKGTSGGFRGFTGFPGCSAGLQRFQEAFRCLLAASYGVSDTPRGFHGVSESWLGRFRCISDGLRESRVSNVFEGRT